MPQINISRKFAKKPFVASQPVLSEAGEILNGVFTRYDVVRDLDFAHTLLETPVVEGD
jgi:hypothetical protein